MHVVSPYMLTTAAGHLKWNTLRTMLLTMYQAMTGGCFPLLSADAGSNHMCRCHNRSAQQKRTVEAHSGRILD